MESKQELGWGQWGEGERGRWLWGEEVKQMGLRATRSLRAPRVGSTTHVLSGLVREWTGPLLPGTHSTAWACFPLFLENCTPILPLDPSSPSPWPWPQPLLGICSLRQPLAGIVSVPGKTCSPFQKSPKKKTQTVCTRLFQGMAHRHVPHTGGREQDRGYGLESGTVSSDGTATA